MNFILKTNLRDWAAWVTVFALLFSLSGLGQIVSRLNPSNAVVAVAGGDSYNPIVSSDGRFVAFASTANNLAVGAGNQTYIGHVPGAMNVFLRDRQLGVTTLVSINAAGTGGGNDDSFPSALSDDGRYVCFESAASDLVPGDTNGVKDIFVRDLTAGMTTLVSASANGGCANGESREAAMTPDGRYVAFVSAASNLVANDSNGIADIFVRDLQAGVTTLASVGATPIGNLQVATPNTPGASSEWPSISTDGRYVAFYSTALYLVPKLTNTGEIFMRDMVSNVTVFVSTNAHAILPAPISGNYTMTPDGQFIAYYGSQSGLHPTGAILRYHTATGLTDLVATNGYLNNSLDTGERPLDISTNGEFVAFMQTNASVGGSIQIWDAQTGAARLVSGGVSNANCAFPRLDASGRYVAFLSDEGGALTANSDASSHVYVRDTVGGGAQLADLNLAGTAPFSSATAPVSLSAAGNVVAWSAPDGNLAVSAQKLDVFARDLIGKSTAVISVAQGSLGSVTGPGSSSIGAGCVSSNGQVVAFSTDADGLVPSDTNGLRDIYAHNLINGSNTLVSLSMDGATAGNGQSSVASINASGRYVIFASAATNLVANDTNGAVDIFVRDLQSNTTTLVTVDSTGQGEGNGNSSQPALSDDGRYAFFFSAANNLVTNRVSTQTNVLYRRDLQRGATVVISPSGGAPMASMTPDGGKVVWANNHEGFLWQASSGTNTSVLEVLSPQWVLQDMAISPDGTKAVFGATSKIYIVDLVAGTNSLLTNVEDTSLARFQFSGDSRFLACLTAISNINQVYLYDLVNGTNFLISQAYDGSGPGDGACDSPAFSADGRYVAYRSFADNIVPGDTNGLADVFLYDRLSGGTTLVSVSHFGNRAGNSISFTPVFSQDSQTLFFGSWASDIAMGDFNRWADIFAVGLSANSPVASSNSVPPLGFSGITFGATALGSVGFAPMLTWPASLGTGYQVQFKNSLGDAQWQNLAIPATIVGSQGSVVDPAPVAGMRFYRIVSF
jgi:hypothetical protein